MSGPDQDTWLPGISFDVYNAIPRVRGSEMSTYFGGGLERVEHRRAHGLDESRPMMLGTYGHAVIEGVAAEEWVIAPEGVSRRMKAYKELVTLNPDRRVITQVDAGHVEAAAHRMTSRTDVSELIIDGVAEVTMITETMKIRPDIVTEGRLVNWKFTSTLNAFDRWASNFRHHYGPSCGLYELCLEAAGMGGEFRHTYVIGCVEAPYPTAVYEIGTETLAGMKWNASEALEAILEAQRTGVWANPETQETL